MSIWGSIALIIIGVVLSIMIKAGAIQIVAAILIITGMCWLIIGLISMISHYRINHPVNNEHKDSLEDRPIQPG